MNVNLGFLPRPIDGDFTGGSIAPLPDYEARKAAVTARLYSDGYYYPPREGPASTGDDTRPPIHRAALTFKLPMSHVLQIDDPVVCTMGPASDGAALSALVGFLHRTRLHLDGWFIEGRVPLKQQPGFVASDAQQLDFLGHAYQWWRQLEQTERLLYVNATYMSSRADSLQWGWEKFANHYMVLDALFRLHAHLKSKPAWRPPHRDRLSILLEAYDLHRDDLLEQKIYEARNDLFHEALWGGMIPGFGGEEGRDLPHHLGRINSRLLCSMVEFKNDFVRSPWSSPFQFRFGQEPGS